MSQLRVFDIERHPSVMKLHFWCLFIIPTVASFDWEFKLQNVDRESLAMKNIIAKCHKNRVNSNPVLIIGDFEGYVIRSMIDSVLVPMIMINNRSDWERHSRESSEASFLNAKPEIVITMENSAEEFESDIKLLQKTKHWNYMAVYFVLEISESHCENGLDTLRAAWKMDISKAIYICSNMENETLMLTLNPLTNYATGPWEKVINAGEFNSSGDWTLFSQPFKRNNISCASLTFNRLKYLNGYTVKALTTSKNNAPFVPGKNYGKSGYKMVEFFGKTVFDTIITRLNATLVLQIDKIQSIPVYISNKSMDIDIRFTLSYSNINTSYTYPYFQPEVIAITRTKDYLSTLEKISQLWGRSVLALSLLSILITFLVMGLYKKRGFGLAFLDIVRLLIASSILFDIRGSPMRIFFSKILIFMVIMNGVFQGRLAAFLTKPEEGFNPDSAEDLERLNYTIYGIQQNVDWLRTMFPNNQVIMTKQKDCVEKALSSFSGACVGTRAKYLNQYWMKPIHITKEPLLVSYYNHPCRKDWPLQPRVDAVLTRIMESGLLDRWAIHSISIVVDKKRAQDEERLATQYRPVKLKALDFSFALLGIGLVIASVTFVVEKMVGRNIVFVVDGEGEEESFTERRLTI